jgi:hypothetical protein
MTEENEIQIDPITKLAGEFDGFKSEFENLKQDYIKIKADNTALIETNRKLLGELGRMTTPAQKEEEEEISSADLAYNAFMKTSGFKE